MNGTRKEVNFPKLNTIKIKIILKNGGATNLQPTSGREREERN